MLASLIAPDPSLNYFVIACCFAFFSAAAVLLYALEKSEALGDTLTGWWMVPSPSLPALAWVLWMHARQHAAAARAKAE